MRLLPAAGRRCIVSNATVSVSLTKKQQGELYMKSLHQGDRIKEMKAALREIIAMAEAIGAFDIKVKAEAVLQGATKKGGA